MPRASMQDGWVNRNINFPIGFIAAVLLAGHRTFPPQNFPDYIRGAIATQIGYDPHRDQEYIEQVAKLGLLDQTLLDKAQELGLYAPPPPSSE